MEIIEICRFFVKCSKNFKWNKKFFGLVYILGVGYSINLYLDGVYFIVFR